MIHILPHLEYSIDSAKSPEDICTILNSVTVPRGELLCDSRDVEFTGEVNPSGFKIVREVTGRIYLKNDFRPVILGKIRVERGQTVIDIKMRLHLFVQIFLAVWFGGVGVYFLSGLLTVFTKGENGVSMLLGAVGFFVFGQVLARIGFYFSARYTRKILEELLK